MTDDRLIEIKGRVAKKLIDRLNQEFYPLSCRSYDVVSQGIDDGLRHALMKKDIQLSREKENEFISRYVHFRLALAKVLALRELGDFPFIEERDLHFDMTHSFDGVFAHVSQAVAPYRSGEAKEGRILPLVSFLSSEVGVSLISMEPALNKETEGYLERVKGKIEEYRESFALCDEGYREKGKKKLPFLFLKGLMTVWGEDMADMTVESTLSLHSLLFAAPFMKEGKRENALFFYHLLLFRALILCCMGSYLYEDRRLRKTLYEGIAGSAPFQKVMGEIQRIGSFTKEDFFFSREIYQIMNEFIGEIPMLRESRKKDSLFMISLKDWMAGDRFDGAFGDFITKMSERDHVTLQEEDRIFLHDEMVSYMDKISHALYFSYEKGIRNRADCRLKGKEDGIFHKMMKVWKK